MPSPVSSTFHRNFDHILIEDFVLKYSDDGFYMTSRCEFQGVGLKADDYLHNPLWVRFDNGRHFSIDEEISAISLMALCNTIPWNTMGMHVEAFCLALVSHDRDNFFLKIPSRPLSSKDICLYDVYVKTIYY